MLTRRHLRLRRTLMVTTILAGACAALPARAQSGAAVAAGAVSIAQSGANTTIRQSTEKAIINWQSFGVATGATMQFVQPNSAAIALNRVTGSGVSAINGTLLANGQVWIINPNGVMFGAGSTINVAGLIATTADIANSDFLAGNYNFSGVSANPNASIVNRGSIATASGGAALLVGPHVENQGVIEAQLGTVVLGGANAFTVAFEGDTLLSFAISAPVTQTPLDATGKPVSALVSNAGTIAAAGGTVMLTARAARNVIDNAINMSGVIEANTAHDENGDIVLDAGSTGGASVSGTLDAAGKAAGATGGTVELVGNSVTLQGTARIDASGDAGGGTVLVGGDLHGAGPLPNAQSATVASGAAIDASAITSGNGGTVVVRSEGNTVFDGSIAVRGGAQSGNGGMIETSGGQLTVRTGTVDASAAAGMAGNWLLDPTDLTVSNVSGESSISAAKINHASATVTLEASHDVDIDAAIDMAFNGVGITVIAGNDVTVAAGASITTRGGALTFTANSNLLGTASGSGSITIAAPLATDGHGETGGAISLALAGGSGSIGVSGALTTVAGAISLTGPVVLNASSNLTTADGNIGAAIAIAGTVNAAASGGQSLSIDAGNARVTLTGAIGGATALGDLTIAGASLVMPATTLTGDLALQSTGGAIAQNGPLTVAGATILAAGTNDILLANAANRLGLVTVTSGGNVTLADAGALTLGAASVSDNLSVTAAGITQTGPLNVAAMTTLAAGTNDIELANSANVLPSLTVTSGGNVTLFDADALTLGASTVSGSLSLTAAGITQTGALGVAGTTTLAAGANDIALANAANALPSLIVTSGGIVTVADADALTLGASTVSGSLSLTAAGITQTGPLSVAGGTTLAAGTNDIMLANAANALPSVTVTSAGNVTLVDAEALTLGASIVSGSLSLTAAGITQTGPLGVAGGTTLAAGSNDIALTNAANMLPSVTITSGGNVTLIDAAALALGPSVVSGNLAATAVGITQSGALRVAGATTLAAGTNDITLADAANALPSVTVTSAGNVTLVDVDALTLGASTVSGNLSLTAAGISQTGPLSVTGGTTLAAGTNEIALANAANALPSVAVTSGGNVTFVDADALTLGASTVSGNLSLTAAGISQTGPLSVTGGTTLAAGTNDIALANAANALPSVTLTSRGNVTLVDADALTLGASTVSGNLSLTAAGITQTGPLSVTGGTTLAAGTNEIALANAANALSSVTVTSAGNVTLVDVDALTLGASTVSGNLSLTAAGISQTGSLSVTGGTTLAAGTNEIALANAANALPSVTVTSGGNVTFVDADALTLGASTVSGNLSLTAAGITQTGPLSVTGGTTLAAGTNDIALANAANALPSVTLTSRGNVTLVDADALTLGASTVSGNLSLTAAGISQTGPLSVTGGTTLAAGTNDIALANAANALPSVAVVSGGNVTLVDADALVLGASTVSGDLSLTAAGITQTGPLRVAGGTTLATGNNDITLTNAANALPSLTVTSAGNVTLTDADALALGASTVSGNLSLAAAGITQNAALSVAGGTTLAAGTNDITLANAANQLGSITLTSAGTVTVVDAEALTLGPSNVSRNLSVSAAGIAQSGALNVEDTTVLAAGVNDITLDNTANALSSLAVTSAGNVTLVDAGALTLGASTVSANLSLTAAGITQNGPLNVAGTTTLATGSHDITLGNVANALPSVTVTSAGNVTLVDADALMLGASTVSGNLSLTAAGIAQTGPLSVAGGTTLAAGANEIALANAANALSSVTVTSAGNVTLVDADALTLGASTVSGNLSLSAAGITQTGSLSVTGGTTLAAGTNEIALANAANALPSVTVTSGGNVTFVDADALTLGASTVSGNLSLTAAGITQTGPLSVTGGTTLAAGTNDIALGNGANALPSVTVTSAGNVTLVDADALTLGASTVVGNLTVSGAGITQTGALSVGGIATLAAGSGDIALTNPTNALPFVVIASGGTVTLIDAGAVSLGASTVSGELSVAAAGIAETGPLSVAGAATLAAGGNDITLADAANALPSVTIKSGGNVTIVDSAALALGASAVSGNLSLTAAGIAQTGPLSVAGGTILAAGGNDISLANAANRLPSLAVTSAGNVTLTDADALTLGASTVSGNLSLTAAGISQTGTLSVTGGTTLAAGTNDIALTNAANVLPSVTVTSAGNVTLVDADALTLGASTVSGNLSLTAAGITQTGPLTVTGGTTLAAGGNDIALSNAANVLPSVTVTSGGNVTLIDTGALALGASSVSGNLALTAAGITQSGALDVGGAATLTSRGAAADIDFGGSALLASASSFTLVAGRNIVVTGTIENSGAGAVTLVAGWDGVTPPALAAATPGAFGSNGGSVTIGGGAGNAAVGSAGGPTTVVAANLTLQAANGFAQLGYDRAGATGSIAVSVTGTLALAGGGAGDFAQIGQGGAGVAGDSAGNIGVLAGGEVSLSGGSGSFAYAQIGNGGGGGSGSAAGSIALAAGGAVSLSGGTGALAYAQIGHGGGESNLGTTTGFSDVGNIDVSGASVSLVGGGATATYAQIGHGGYEAGANADIVNGSILYSGNVAVTTSGLLTLVGNAHAAYAQIGSGGDLIDANSTVSGTITETGGISVQSGAVALTADDYAQIGNGGYGFNDGASASQIDASGNIGITITAPAGTTILTGGATTIAYVQLGNGDPTRTGEGNVSGNMNWNGPILPEINQSVGIVWLGNGTGSGTVNGTATINEVVWTGSFNPPSNPLGDVGSLLDSLLNNNAPSPPANLGGEGGGAASDTVAATLNQIAPTEGPGAIETLSGGPAAANGTPTAAQDNTDSAASGISLDPPRALASRVFVAGVQVETGPAAQGLDTPVGVPASDEEYLSWGNEALWQ